jgi:HEAT repeat protein
MRAAALETVLKIRPAERRTVFLVLALMGLGWAGAAAGATGIESLFFARLGPEYLPYMYVILGPVTFTVMVGLSVLLSRGALRFLVRIPVGLAVALVAGRALLELGGSWIYGVLWLTMMVLWIVQGMSSWAIAGAVSDTRQAKRLFPLFGAGLIAGGAMGGFATGPLASWLGPENLLLVWAVSLLLAALLARNIVRSAVPLVTGRRRRASRPRRGEQLTTGLRELQSSGLLRWMSISMILFSILYFTLPLLFATAATERFPEANDLAGFLGLMFGASSAAALLVALTGANRVITKLGLPAAVLSLAALYLAGFAVLAIQPSFAGLVVFRFAQLVWFGSVWTTAWQALFNVVPEERRAQVRTSMDGGPLQAGVMISGVLLLLADRALDPRHLYVVGASVAGAAVGAMWMARRAYGRALIDALRAGNPDVFRPDREAFGGYQYDAHAVATVLRGCADPDPGVRKLSLEIVSELPGDDAAPVLRGGLADPEPDVRAIALRGLTRIGRPPDGHALVSHLGDPSVQVRLAALHALKATDGAMPDSAVRGLLTDPNPGIRGHAAGALLAQNNAEGRAVLSEMIFDSDPSVRRAAVDAISLFNAQTWEGQLIHALADEDASVRGAAVAALVALGPSVQALLLDALGDPEREGGALIALTGIPGPRPEELFSYARGQVSRARHFHRLWLAVRDHGTDEFRLLAVSLRHRALEHGMKALRSLTRDLDQGVFQTALENLSSRDSQQRANALEALEAIGNADVVVPLLPLWDPPPNGRQSSESAVSELLDEDDPWLRACAARVVPSSDSASTRRLEELVRSDPDPLVREAASATLRAAMKGARMETLSTLSLLDRVMFLRGVKLLSDLSPGDLKHVAEAATEHIYPDGEVIAEQGDAGDEMHIVVSGQIGVVVDSKAGQSREIARRTRGEYVGEMSILSEEPRMASLVCSGPVRTLSLDRKRFRRILRERPDAGLAVMQVLCDRLREATNPRS